MSYHFQFQDSWDWTQERLTSVVPNKGHNMKCKAPITTVLGVNKLFLNHCFFCCYFLTYCLAFAALKLRKASIVKNEKCKTFFAKRDINLCVMLRQERQTLT